MCQGLDRGNRGHRGAVSASMRTLILITLGAALLAAGCGDRWGSRRRAANAASQTAVSPLVRELSADARRAIRLNGGRHVTREQAVATSHRAAAQVAFRRIERRERQRPRLRDSAGRALRRLHGELAGGRTCADRVGDGDRPRREDAEDGRLGARRTRPSAEQAGHALRPAVA